MRMFVFSLTAAVAIVSAASFTADRADAMTVGTATGIQAALQDTKIVQDVRIVCRHRTFSSRERCRDVVVCRHRPLSSRRVCY